MEEKHSNPQKNSFSISQNPNETENNQMIKFFNKKNVKNEKICSRNSEPKILFRIIISNTMKLNCVTYKVLFYDD